MFDVEERGQVHLIPDNDEREHIRDFWCWCEPDFEEHDDRILVGHHAADMRHLVEEATGEMSEPGKGWTIFDDRERDDDEFERQD